MAGTKSRDLVTRQTPPHLRAKEQGERRFSFIYQILVFYIGKCYIGRTMEVAVIKTGGKQYVVSKGDTIAIEKLPGDLKKGDTVVFGEVLLVDNGSDTTIGAPTIEGAEVKGTVVLAGKAKKIEVVKLLQARRPPPAGSQSQNRLDFLRPVQKLRLPRCGTQARFSAVPQSTSTKLASPMPRKRTF